MFQHILIQECGKMSISVSSIRCSLQVALLGAVTNNLRALNVIVSEKLITLAFYYESHPSEEEEEISEVIASEVSSDFIDASIEVNRIVLDGKNKIPEIGIRVFHRSE